MKTKNYIGRMIKTGLVALALAASACVPYKLCREGKLGPHQMWECKQTKSVTGDWNKDQVRVTSHWSNIIIDREKDGNYEIWIDKGNDGTVDTYYSEDGKIHYREEFGNKYDRLFRILKQDVGKYEKTIEMILK